MLGDQGLIATIKTWIALELRHGSVITRNNPGG
jgi:hypothetical protein